METDALIILAQATSEATSQVGPSEKTLSDEDWRGLVMVFAAFVGLILLAFVAVLTLVLRYFRRWRWTRALLTAVLTAPVCLGLFLVIAKTRAALTGQDYAALSSGGGLPALLALLIPFAVAFLWPRRSAPAPANTGSS